MKKFAIAENIERAPLKKERMISWLNMFLRKSPSFIHILIVMNLIHLTAMSEASGQISEKPAVKAAKPEWPKEKETTLGLYVTSKEAYKMWLAAPEKIRILDVRTPDEYIFIGHAAMAWNVPLAIQTYDWDADKKQFRMKPNPEFLSGVKDIAGPKDTLLVMCRSGGRSAMAVNQLAAAGYKNVYNIMDGFEGDIVTDPVNVYVGQRMVNGWKNSGLPWTYAVNPDQMSLPLNQ